MECLSPFKADDSSVSLLRRAKFGKAAVLALLAMAICWSPPAEKALADMAWASALPPRKAQKRGKLHHRDILHTKFILEIGAHRDKSRVLKAGVQDKCLYREKMARHLAAMRGKTLAEKCREAKRLSLSIKYMEDTEKYGKKDVWAGPDLSFGLDGGKNGGDCEDYCIYEYKILRLMGVDADDMFISIGITSRDRHHAVLAVYDRGLSAFHILDNASARLESEKSMEGRFLPFYSLNENGCWNNILDASYEKTARLKMPGAMKIWDRERAKAMALFPGKKNPVK